MSSLAQDTDVTPENLPMKDFQSINRHWWLHGRETWLCQLDQVTKIGMIGWDRLACCGPLRGHRLIFVVFLPKMKSWTLGFRKHWTDPGWQTSYGRKVLSCLEMSSHERQGDLGMVLDWRRLKWLMMVDWILDQKEGHTGGVGDIWVGLDSSVDFLIKMVVLR